MKRLVFLIILAIWLPSKLMAQGENSIWTFASAPGANSMFMNFNGVSPVFTSTPNYTFAYGSAVCYPNGQLRFFVRLTYNNSTMPPLMNIFNASGQPIPNSNLLTGMLDEGCQPVIVPCPGNNDQYYIFYGYSKGLLYSLLDMSINGGQDGIVAGQKDIVVATYGTVNTQKMTAVKGCDGVWIVLRSRVANQYLSFRVTSNGVATTPVISEVGQYSVNDYNLSQGIGYLKATQDGSRIAISGYKGLELYDFESCSGKVKNARILDTTGNALPLAQSIFNHVRFQGLSFSPDGSKVYVTRNKRSTATPTGLVAGELYQFDLNQPTLAAMIASKTLILTNQPSIMENGGTCNYPVPNPLGEIKAGPNGKLYVDNGSYTCLSPSNIPAGFNPGPGFHVINLPNLPGVACSPQLNALIVNDFSGNQDGSFFASADGGISYLSQDIVVAPPPPDTASGQVFHASFCFNNTAVLSADASDCYRWDNGINEKDRIIDHSGTYYVSYFKNCSYTTDTFHVNLFKLPLVTQESPSCPDMFMGKLIALVDSDNTEQLNYIWRTGDSSIIRSFSGRNGDSIMGLNPGNYFLEVSTSSGCDTFLPVSIEALPKSEIAASPVDTTIRYGDSLLLHAEGALFYAWSPSTPLDTPTKADPIARPIETTMFSVIGMNEYGCIDTAYLEVNIDFAMRDFVPNAFSPNWDGINDLFKIENIIYQKVVTFQVFNRFGQLVFSTLDGHNGWDGTQDGKPSEVGTYYYFIQLDYPDGRRKSYKGDVVLVR